MLSDHRWQSFSYNNLVSAQMFHRQMKIDSRCVPFGDRDKTEAQLLHVHMNLKLFLPILTLKRILQIASESELTDDSVYS